MNTERKEIGKIESVSFGLGGYQDAMIGLHVTLSGKSWGVTSTKSTWDPEAVKNDTHCSWTEHDRDAVFAETARYLSKLLKDAGARNVAELKGKPIEATFDGMQLKSWRILTEVL